MYLLDTNVISELRKIHSGRSHPAVAAWNDTVDLGDLYLSVVTLYELELGMLRLQRRDPAQAAVLREWLRGRVATEFHGRMLPVDLAIVQRSAQTESVRSRPAFDSLIAATAYVHGLTVVTRNVANFDGCGVRLLNPFENSLKEGQP